MTRDYLVTPINPVTEQAMEGVVVTVHTILGAYGADADGRRGVEQEEIIGMEVEPDDLPAWATLEAKELARVRWMAGR